MRVRKAFGIITDVFNAARVPVSRHRRRDMARQASEDGLTEAELREAVQVLADDYPGPGSQLQRRALRPAPAHAFMRPATEDDVARFMEAIARERGADDEEGDDGDDGDE